MEELIIEEMTFTELSKESGGYIYPLCMFLPEQSLKTDQEGDSVLKAYHAMSTVLFEQEGEWYAIMIRMQMNFPKNVSSLNDPDFIKFREMAVKDFISECAKVKDEGTNFRISKKFKKDFSIRINKLKYE